MAITLAGKIQIFLHAIFRKKINIDKEESQNHQFGNSWDYQYQNPKVLSHIEWPIDI